MKKLFYILSAINNDYGHFSYQERFSQLLGSIDSVKRYCPASDIFIIDASYRPFPEKDAEILRSQVQGLREIYDHPLIIWSGEPVELVRRPHALERKTLGEILLMQSALNDLEKLPDTYDRVFKLSGRFRLNDHFNNIDYSRAENQIVLLKRERWDKEAYPLRLWSFDYAQLNDIKRLYQIMLEKTFVNNIVVELIEKSMYRWVNHLNIPRREIEGMIGVEGSMGADGIALYE